MDQGPALITFDAIDPMYGLAVHCKRSSSSWRMRGLASMYPVFDWSLLCSGEIKMSFPFRRV
jgi:hypothetical protein